MFIERISGIGRTVTYRPTDFAAFAYCQLPLRFYETCWFTLDVLHSELFRRHCGEIRVACYCLRWMLVSLEYGSIIANKIRCFGEGVCCTLKGNSTSYSELIKVHRGSLELETEAEITTFGFFMFVLFFAHGRLLKHLLQSNTLYSMNEEIKF